LEKLDPADVANQVQAGELVPITFDGQTVRLSPEEILVDTQPVEGLAVAADKMVTVAVEATITPALRAEGLAREIVRRVQAMRKNADFNIEDRIHTYYVAEGELAEVFETWGDYIKSETLSTDLVAGVPPEKAHVESHKVDRMDFTLGVKRKG
jgi:isoleucyl-tRNA synthetase